MDVRQLRFFFAICDWGSLAGAARRVGTTSSNLSTQLCQLEHELGVRLCERSSAGIEITAAGEHLYRVGRRLVQAFEFAVRYSAAPAPEAPIALTFGTPLMPRGSVLAEALYDAQRALSFEDANLDIRIADFSMPVTSEYELCAVLDPFTGSERVDSIVVEDRWCLVTRRSGGEAQADEIELEGLQQRAGRRRMVRPKLPPILAQSVADLAARLDIEIFDTGLAANLEHQDAIFERGSAVLLPLSCVPGCWLQPRFHTSTIALPNMNPRWSFQQTGNVAPQVVRRFADKFNANFQHRLTSILDLNASAQTAQQNAMSNYPPIAIREAHCFDVTFEFGNISRAAAELRISQPALSTGLHRIEERLGKQLFRRTTHGVVPTEHGLALRQSLRPILEDLAELRRTLAGLRSSKGPAPIRVGMVPALDEGSLLAEAMALAIAEWSESFKQNSITVVEGFNARLRRWTVQEELDIAIVDTDVRQSGLVLTPLLEDAMVVVTSPKYRTMAPGAINGIDVNRLNLALPSNWHGLRGVVDRAFQEAGLLLVPKIEIDSMAAAVRLVKSGDWATILPVSAVRMHAAAGELQINEIVAPIVTRSLSMIRRSDRSLDDPCRRFVAMFTERLQEPIAT